MYQQPSLMSQLVPPEMWHFPMLGLPPQLQQSSPATATIGRLGRGDAASAIEEAAGGVMMVEQSVGGKGRRKRKELFAGGSEDDSTKLVSTSSGIDLTDATAKRVKVSKSIVDNVNVKAEVEANSDDCNKHSDQNAQSSEPPKQDYIHVRARRGQATDSHSLAERARREKISERMKILQDLVPGCNKVIGKASVLDEIINYIQALQHQVEFLSMKLEAVNSRISSGIEVLPPKDVGFPGGSRGSVQFGASAYESAPGLAFGSQAAREFAQSSETDWLHMQVGGAYERVT